MASIDLRPMTLGEVLDRTFALYRQNFLLFAGISALPHLLLLLFRFALLLSGRAKVMTPAGGTSSSTDIGSAVLAAIGGGLFSLLILGLVQAATVSAVSDLYLGRETSVRASYLRAKGQVLPVIGIIIMCYLATVVGLILLIIPGIILACRLTLSVPAAIVEQTSPIRSMERSMELTKGHAMQIFLLFVLVFFIAFAVAALFQFPVFFLAFNATKTKQAMSIGASAYTYLAEFVSQVVVGPVGTIAYALMYYNLRVRKEGFDIQHLLSTLGPAPVQGS